MRSFVLIYACRSAVYVIHLLEALLWQTTPVLVRHLAAMDVNAAQIGFSWCYSGFVSLLPPTQVLMLWDRLLGYMDLTLLPILAVSIFMFRSETLLSVSAL
jgi:hypothetical protein